MAEASRPRKRARGSYSKLICLRCRERRIKCQLANDGSIEPSSEPQPASKACQRCKTHGYGCIVRKTTLGRPNQKLGLLPTPPTQGSEEHRQSRSPTPDEEDLVLLSLEEQPSGRTKNRSSSINSLPQGVHMQVPYFLYRTMTNPQSLLICSRYAAVNRTFDLTSALLYGLAGSLIWRL
jgi:hypothetical protein